MITGKAAHQEKKEIITIYTIAIKLNVICDHGYGKISHFVTREKNRIEHFVMLP